MAGPQRGRSRCSGRSPAASCRAPHETLDRHASNPAVRRLEHLLVATGALPTRDPALAWVVLRRYRRKSQRALLNDGVLSRAKVEMRSAAAFLRWLAERDRPLEECGQADVDAWLAGERADRYIARSFARFAMAQKLVPKLDFQPGGAAARRRRSSPRNWPSSLSGCSTTPSYRLATASPAS